MTTTLPAFRQADSSSLPTTGRHQISPLLLLVLLAAVLWIGALTVRRRARRRRTRGDEAR